MAVYTGVQGRAHTPSRQCTHAAQLAQAMWSLIPRLYAVFLKKILYYNNNMNFSFHFVSSGKVSIVREVLHKEDFRVAESGLLQRGGVGPLLCREAGQDTAGEVGLNLELLGAFFQGEQEVMDHLGKKHRNNCQLGEQ